MTEWTGDRYRESVEQNVSLLKKKSTNLKIGIGFLIGESVAIALLAMAAYFF